MSEMRDWLRKLATGEVPDGVSPPEFVPALVAEAIQDPAAIRVVSIEPGKLEEAIAQATAEAEEEKQRLIEDIKSKALNPEQVLANCREMSEAQYQAYMTQLQEQDAEFFQLVVEAIAAETAKDEAAKAEAVKMSEAAPIAPEVAPIAPEVAPIATEAPAAPAAPAASAVPAAAKPAKAPTKKTK